MQLLADIKERSQTPFSSSHDTLWSARRKIWSSSRTDRARKRSMLEVVSAPKSDYTWALAQSVQGG